MYFRKVFSGYIFTEKVFLEFYKNDGMQVKSDRVQEVFALTEVLTNA